MSHQENAQNSEEKQSSVAWSSPKNDRKNANYDVSVLTIPFLTGEEKRREECKLPYQFHVEELKPEGKS